MSFEIGQQVKIIGTKDELAQYFAEDGFGFSGIVLSIDAAAGLASIRVKFADRILWFNPQHLAPIPDDGKHPAAPSLVYPPLRVLLPDGTPSLTWQQVLREYPMAERQPHLFLCGSYAWYSMDDLNDGSYNYIVLDAVHEPGATCTLVTYRVFVITEE